MKQRIRLQIIRRRQHSIQRMTGAVIARVHHDELACESVLRAKRLTRRRIVTDRLVVRPWRIDVNHLLTHALGHQAFCHEAIQRDDA